VSADPGEGELQHDPTTVLSRVRRLPSNFRAHPAKDRAAAMHLRDATTTVGDIA
jgi:hypothetical protein